MNKRGSLSVEATIALPIMLYISYILFLMPLSKVYFNTFEKELVDCLMATANRSFNLEQVYEIAERHSQLEIENITMGLNEINIIVVFESMIKRKWSIKYDIRVPHLESLLYITDTGVKYHHFGCIYLRESMIPTLFTNALLNYESCKACALN